jgi:pSer/pThr/pTyr-binding forkhead associated (FHA) protein
VPDLALHLLTATFILLLYGFLWMVGRNIAGHLRRESARSEMPTVLIAQSASQSGLTFRVTRPLVLGRSAEADVVLEDPYASDFHARLVFQAGEVRIQDLGSTNGTFVNGERMAAPMSLRRGDQIRVGQTIMEVR